MDLTFHTLQPPAIKLPGPLADLEKVAMNFYWSWQPEGLELFRSLDPALWDQVEQSPLRLLAEIGSLRLWQMANDNEYVARLANFVEKQDLYLAQVTVPNPGLKAGQIAYFCAEYGIHNSLPIYSGGLGILAGDHLKSASDLNIPLVAVGLLYRYGYFRQNIAHDGWQEERYTNILTSGLAVEPVTDENGERVTAEVHIRGREVHAQAWLVNVGRIKLYLLDTNISANTDIDRMITGHLYGGDTETRIVQEKVLGIGGVRLLKKLGISPSVYHLNEGHSAFLTLELAHDHLAANPDASFENARNVVRTKCVFTTHTPVSAGNDSFSTEQLNGCFDREFIAGLKLTDQEFFGLGRIDPDDDSEQFGMTPLSLRMCRSANGVSEKHGEVSRQLWVSLFPEATIADEVPISHVTNGVHPATWIAAPFQAIFRKKMGEAWASASRHTEKWAEAIGRLSDDEIWQTHLSLKQLLIAFVRERTRAKETGSKNTIHEHRDTRGLFSANVLTIGFARRVAAYKRWNLLLSDLDRLLRMVDDASRPVQFVFAGKAHPQDRTAKQILQELVSINHESNWQKRAVFIEDYDQEVARYLVQGVDVWMNVPRRPFEASGTSGMKAAMNGVLNFSVLDGWWIEGYSGTNGFAIGGLEDELDDATADENDAESLYSTLESVLIPEFYELDERGMPSKWIARMRDSISTLTPRFSSERMVKDYLNKIYNSANRLN